MAGTYGLVLSFVNCGSSQQPNTFYAALKSGGVGAYQHDRPTGMKLVSNLETSQFGGLDVTYLATQGTYLYAALGDLFTDSEWGFASINISSPTEPVVSSLWVSSEIGRGSTHVHIEGNLAFVSAMDKGVFVYDISDPELLRYRTSIVPDQNFPVESPNSVQRPNARATTTKGFHLYVAYDAGGIRVMDIQNLDSPVEVARYINQAPSLKQQAYNDLVIIDHLMYVTVDYCGLETIDISDLSNLSRINWFNPWACDTTSNNWFNSPGHLNQVVFDEERNTLLVSGGDRELIVFDLTDPSKPREVFSIGEPGDGQAAWGVSTAGNRVYLGYITALVPFNGTWSGIKIFQY